MEKLSQERGLLNKLREKTNITGKILESLNPEFQEMMERLRSTDERIREHAAQVKELTRGAKSLLNRRDYLSSAASISAFHERCRYISAELQKFISSVDMKHYKFLLDQFDDEQKEQLFGYDPNKEIKFDEENAADDKVVTASLRKEAGLSDWWFKMTDPIADVAHNLTNSKGVAMRALEKRFSISFLKELKVNSQVMVIKTQKFSQFLLAVLKKLATFLAKRNVDQYVALAKTFISKFTGYHDSFVKFYQKSIVPLKDQHQKVIEDQRKAEELHSKKIEEDAARQREQATPQNQNQNVNKNLYDAFVSPNSSGVNKPAPVSQTKNVDTAEGLANLRDMLGDDEEEKDNLAFDLNKKQKAAYFISKIEKYASNDEPKSLLNAILAYSEEMEKYDTNASLKLLAVAEGMVEDYKTAGIFDFLKKDKEEVEKPKEENLPDPLP